MSIRKILFLSMFLLTTACSNDIFLVHNGNIPAKEKIAEIHLGQNKQDVMNILGAPSLTTGLSDDHWIYMASTVKKVAFFRPEELERNVLAVSFDNNKISKIEKLTLADGNNLGIDTDITKATEQEQGFFRKYFGGVGAYMPFGGTNTNKEL
ncbi:MAG: outer membrane protein assembly factor BamE [Pseudomonadota bacterium]|nr:outer membrane protein assembly factor BamE [Pseudomonadota bacterium]